MNAKIAETNSLKKLLICAMLTAVGTLLSGPLSIPAMPFGAYSLKIGLGTLPVILAAVLYGPMYGGMVGGIADFLQATMFPKGAYVPWFTLVAILFGLIPGLFFTKHREVTLGRLAIAISAGQLAGSVLANTALLVWLYGMPWELMLVRLINQAIMIPIYTGLIYYLVKLLKKVKVIQ